MNPHLDALKRALVRIEKAFNFATRYHLHKRRVRAIMRAGATHPDALRYQRIVEQVNPDIVLGGAVAISQRCYRMEQQRRENIARIWGVCHEPRIRLMLLDELRLMLRWCQRFAPDQFVVWRDQLQGRS